MNLEEENGGKCLIKQSIRTEKRYSGYVKEKGVLYIGFLGHIEGGQRGEEGCNGRKRRNGG